MILLTKFLKDLRVKPLTLAVPIRYKPYNSAIWIILTRSVFPGWWWWGSKGERHRVWLHQEDLWRDVCLGLLLALDQDSRGEILFVFLQFFPLTTFPPGVVHHRVWPLHWTVHHPLYRGQRPVHERRSLRRGIRWNVSMTLNPNTNESQRLIKCIYINYEVRAHKSCWPLYAMQCSQRFCKLK